MEASIASGIECGLLAQWIRNRSERMLLLDCRPFMAFNEGHIVTSCNVHCPPILKRRSGGFVALENIVPCEKRRQKLEDGEFDTVVVYDSNTSDLANSAKDSNLYSVLKSFRQQVETVSDCEPVEILPYLYLGNFQHASQLELLQRLGITALMNVSTNCKNHFEEHLQYMNIEVNDTDSADLSSWFPQAISFIDSVKERNGKVLVHCQAGVSRSATICLAYLMFTVKIGLEAAFEHVKSRRSVISPNLNFMSQLKNFEQELGLSDQGSSNPSLSNTSSSTDTGSSGAFDYSGHEAMSTELSSCSASQTFSQGSSFSGSFDFPSASSYSSPQASLLSPKKDGWILETHGAILPNRYVILEIKVDQRISELSTV
ncbi:hypothetical protein KUTeg_005599 [Tegillarca granosa]|uniref:protein-tyrosine-phosphatase n=1 Tax=Tegillarca granosa TaxID=220873 RepID=A0ABQ9FN66_TEGGR|nr:hypothetical protein KUTeg_005599 [Tegillarca granosa]